MRQHLDTAPTHPRGMRPDVPEVLDEIVVCLLAKDPAERPPGASAVTAMLQAIQHPPAITAVHPATMAAGPAAQLAPTVTDEPHAPTEQASAAKQSAAAAAHRAHSERL